MISSVDDLGGASAIESVALTFRLPIVRLLGQ